jgi:hypothetical protein
MGVIHESGHGRLPRDNQVGGIKVKGIKVVEFRDLWTGRATANARVFDCTGRGHGPSRIR